MNLSKSRTKCLCAIPSVLPSVLHTVLCSVSLAIPPTGAKMRASLALQHVRVARMRRNACFCFASMLAKQRERFVLPSGKTSVSYYPGAKQAFRSMRAKQVVHRPVSLACCLYSTPLASVLPTMLYSVSLAIPPTNTSNTTYRLFDDRLSSPLYRR